MPSPRAVNAALASVAALGLGLTGLVALSGGASAATANLVVNPGFETGTLANWTCDAGTGAVTTSTVHSGSYALAATPTASDDAQCTQTISVQPNSSYTLSAWVNGPYAYLGTQGDGTTDVSTWSDTSSWNQLSTTFSTGASTTSVTIYLHGWYGQSTYYADDVVLSGAAGPSPSPTQSGSPSPSASASASSSPSSSPTPTATATTPTPTSTATGSGGGGNPKHWVTGYWQDFDNGATDQTIADVNSEYNLIAVAFANADSAGDGGITFSLDPTLQSKLGGYTDAQFKADIAAKQAAGDKVILSVGGQNGTISITSAAQATAFANSAYSIIQQYGFNGVDIDLENGLNPTYMASALHQLAAKVGSGFILTMAPQTIDVLNSSSDYLATALQVKDILTIMNTQYYNSGSMNGCDGGVYSEGSVDFITSLACTAIQAGLSPNQVGIGVPASSSAAGSGYVGPSVVENALNCLAKDTNCGTFKPSTTWPTIGGVMTWSTAWDASNGNQFATNEGAFVHAMP
ncbi:chitinase [Streptacidiphilus fuscans]|uniref:chitinase n=1 Tax=Streptacidiphilus fuscans TaxID=2789292 RepID=A0A931FDL5_9ACTN|nr:glycosyl hydrolase family 18 protein [Streptacidiphilus fuscans]MBF9067731.1 carbohydrate binding domain-containing protein [Streptacidiphilus fuscans]